MKCFTIVIAGTLLGFILLTLLQVHWIVPMLIVLGPLVAVLIWRRPEYGLYLFFILIAILTDSIDPMDPMAKHADGIFAITDPKVVHGLPPLLITFFLGMSLLYFLKFYLLDHKRSAIPVRYGIVLMLILFLATATGLSRGWNHINIRVDFMDVFYPLLSFYLCANVLNTRPTIYRMLAILFVTSVIVATVLDIYYLAGRGWPYMDDNSGLARVVTLDSAHLMIFVAIIITTYSASTHGVLTGAHRILALIGCLPMVFAVVFSFRRGMWIGTIGSLILLYLLSSQVDRRRTRAQIWLAAWVGVVILTIAIPFTNAGSKYMGSALVTRALSVTDANQSSNQHHLLESQQTLKELLASSPLLGLGLGSTHSPILGIDWAAEQQPTRIVHDAYLLAWLRLGLLGLIFVIWLSANYGLILLRYRRSTVSPFVSPIIAGVGSQVGLWFVVLLSGPVLPYWHQTFTITLFAAITVSLIRSNNLTPNNSTGARIHESGQ